MTENLAGINWLTDALVASWPWRKMAIPAIVI